MRERAIFAAEGATTPETLRQKDRNWYGALESRRVRLTDGVIPDDGLRI